MRIVSPDVRSASGGRSVVWITGALVSKKFCTGDRAKRGLVETVTVFFLEAFQVIRAKAHAAVKL